MIWVGIPNDDNPEVTARMEVQDEAVRAAAPTRPDVVFVDTWARFSSGNGGWAEYVVDPRDGKGKDVRAEDGFHLNENGAEILALDIAEVVEADLRARGAGHPRGSCSVTDRPERSGVHRCSGDGADHRPRERAADLLDVEAVPTKRGSPSGSSG